MQRAKNAPLSASVANSQITNPLKHAVGITLSLSFLVFGGGSLASQQKGILVPNLPVQMSI